MSQPTAQPQVRPLADAFKHDEAQLDDTVQMPAVDPAADEQDDDTLLLPPLPDADGLSPEQPTPAEPWREADQRAGAVFARLLAEGPRATSITLEGSDCWREPYIGVYLHHDFDRSRLRAWQDAFGGELTRDEDRFASGQLYSEVSFELDGVKVQVWTLYGERSAAVA